MDTDPAWRESAITGYLRIHMIIPTIRASNLRSTNVRGSLSQCALRFETVYGQDVKLRVKSLSPP